MITGQVSFPIADNGDLIGVRRSDGGADLYLIVDEVEDMPAKFVYRFTLSKDELRAQEAEDATTG